MSLRIGLLEIALATMLAATATGGCGSSTTGGSSNTGGQAGSRVETDSGADTAPESGGVGGNAGTDTGPACVPLGNIATVNAGPLWACFQQSCAPSLTACAADCLCNNGIVGALTCVAAGGMQTTCFFAAATALGNNPNAIVLLGCLATAQSCLMTDAGNGGDTGAGGPTRDSGSAGDASSTGNTNDGGVGDANDASPGTTDADDAGSADDSADAGDTG